MLAVETRHCRVSHLTRRPGFGYQHIIYAVRRETWQCHVSTSRAIYFFPCNLYFACSMPKLDPATKKQLIARVNYYREMGIYDFYRRPVEEGGVVESAEPAAAAETVIADPKESLFDSPLPVITDKRAALKAIREDIGDCTRCRLHKGRKNIVF